MSGPETPAEASTGDTPPDARGRCVLIPVGSSRVCYGPYAAVRADELADALNEGGWMEQHWEVVPLGLLPGERPTPPVQVMRNPLDDPEYKPLFERLEERQGG